MSDTEAIAPPDLPADVADALLIQEVNTLRRESYIHRRRARAAAREISALQSRADVAEQNLERAQRHMTAALKELTDAIKSVSTEQEEIKTGLFGDRFGGKGIVHRLSSMEEMATDTNTRTRILETRLEELDKAKAASGRPGVDEPAPGSATGTRFFVPVEAPVVPAPVPPPPPTRPAEPESLGTKTKNILHEKLVLAAIILGALVIADYGQRVLKFFAGGGP